MSFISESTGKVVKAGFKVELLTLNNIKLIIILYASCLNVCMYPSFAICVSNLISKIQAHENREIKRSLTKIGTHTADNTQSVE
jgi:hypothetical protein